VRNWVNWMLVIVGVVCVIGEMVLGAATGFDLALIGISLAAGGAIGLWFASTKIGLFSAAAMALVYLLFFRRKLRDTLMHDEQPTNVDALMGRAGVVTARIEPHAAGQVKVGDEIWRAELAQADGAARERGETVTVDSVDGVTLKVR
jgi:membrane protein implicated in regulation of membrane protease activity